MSEELKSEDSGAPPSQRPRSPRVPVNFHVEVEGMTETGEPFSMRAEAVRISRSGATLITDARVENDSILRLTPPFGRTLEAQVNGVWIDAADGLQRVGVKLLDPAGWFAE